MNKPLIALAACAGLTAAAPAAAQYAGSPNPVAGSAERSAPVSKGDGKFDPTRDTNDSLASYVKVQKYAECIIGQGESAESILTTKPYTSSERSKTGLLRQRVKVCPAKGFQNLHSLVRGALAEAMYRRQFPQPPVASDPARAKAFVDGEKAFHSARDQGDQVMASVMSCMVAASPQTAHALLATQHGTPAEDSAMNAFFAAGQACGAGATRPTNVSRSFIRAFVADSAWRYARTVTQR